MATKAEKERMARLKEMACVACGAWGVDVHHLTSGGRRLGHMFTIPLCVECHRTGKNSIASGRKNFVRFWGRNEMDMLEETNKLLGII